MAVSKMPGLVVSIGFDGEVFGFDVQHNFILYSLSKKARSTAATPRSSLLAFRKALERDGETISRLRSGGELCNDAFLRRWLSSRNYEIPKAVKALQKHSEWRSAFFPNGYISDDEITAELECNKCFLQGSNTEGHALLVVVARRHDMNKRNFHQTEKLICYTLDVSSALADQGGGQKICCLFDLGGLRLRNLDVKVLSSIFELLQQHYPERLGMLWFINAPFIFWAVWKIVAPLLEDCSRQRIKFVTCQKQRCSSFLQDSVPDNVLPECYGGKAQLIPINIAARSLIPLYTSHLSEVTALSSESKTKESWKAWYRRHEKLSKAGNWIWHVWNSSLNNRITRRIWLKAKDLFWRRTPTFVFPQHLIKKRNSVRSCFNYDPKQIRIGMFVMVVLVVHFVLLVIGHLRSVVLSSVLGDERFCSV